MHPRTVARGAAVGYRVGLRVEMGTEIDMIRRRLRGAPERAPEASSSAPGTPANSRSGCRGGASPRTPGSSQSAYAISKPPCFGCRRVWDKSTDFTDMDNLVVWVYEDGRGAWCRLCWTVWRIMYASIVPVAAFNQYLIRWHSTGGEMVFQSGDFPKLRAY